jgi:hypothetical protein
MPPIPRDNKSPLSARRFVREAGDERQKHSAPASDSIHANEKSAETVITPLVDAPATPAPVYLPGPVPVLSTPDVPLAVNDAGRVRQGASAVSHSSSPAPSLSEALLRARRPATPLGLGTTQPKGTRFKSSFTGVADHVLRLGEQYQQQSQSQTSGDLKGKNREGVTNKDGGVGDGAETQGEA